MIFWCFTFCAIQWNGDFFAILCNRMNREFRYVIFCHLLQFNEPATVFRYFTYDLLRFCGMQWINDIALPCQMLAELAWWQNWRLVCCQKRSAAVLKKVRSSWSLLDLGKKASLCSWLGRGVRPWWVITIHPVPCTFQPITCSQCWSERCLGRVGGLLWS